MTHRLYIDGRKPTNHIADFQSLDDALGFCQRHGVSHKGVFVFTDKGCVFDGRGY